jgi:hypothetical protein
MTSEEAAEPLIVGCDTVMAADAGACEATMTAAAAKVEMMIFLNIATSPVI